MHDHDCKESLRNEGSLMNLRSEGKYIEYETKFESMLIKNKKLEQKLKDKYIWIERLKTTQRVQRDEIERS